MFHAQPPESVTRLQPPRPAADDDDRIATRGKRLSSPRSFLHRRGILLRTNLHNLHKLHNYLPLPPSIGVVFAGGGVECVGCVGCVSATAWRAARGGLPPAAGGRSRGDG